MSYKQDRIMAIKKDGGEADELIQCLVLSLRDDNSLKPTLERIGLSKNACRKIITGEGTVNLDTAIKIARVCGYHLTLEVIE